VRTDDVQPARRDKIPRRYKGPLASFFEAHSRQVFGYACVRTHGDREQAADLVQDTFEAAARNWRNLRKRTEEEQRAWLLKTLSNKVVSEFRRSDAFRRRQPDLYRRYQAREADTSDQALNGIALEQVAKIINGLSDKQKKIALLRWNGNMTLSEIAAELGSAEGTIAAQLHNIRRKLRTGVGPYYPFGSDDGEGCAS
jgi:RNA polymerase sigma-70 factor, ECF subfamily